MSPAGWGALLAFASVVIASAVPLGRYLARVYGDGPAPGDRLFGGFERGVYRLVGVNPAAEQRWTGYATSFLAFSVVSFLALYLLLRLQAVLPGNPTGVGAVDPGLAFNTAMSFTSNTNWQNYSGESTLSHLTQMLGLTTQNFVSAAAGIAVLVAFVRGLARQRTDRIGNFWVDLVRTVTRVLLPLSIVVAVVLVTQGVVQNLAGFTEVVTVEGGSQQIAGGPVASQVAIKQLGTNGGGFFGTNSSVPLENSTWVSNAVQSWAIVVIPFALCITFGAMVGRPRQGALVLAVMVLLWGASTAGIMAAEASGNPRLTDLGVDQSISSALAGGNMEGKEMRFGPELSGLWAGSTTGTSNGSVNSLHTSYTALGGGLATLNMLLGEVSPGGVGVGLAGMLVMAILAVFIAGLMVGRTPEFLGKTIGIAEMKIVTLYVLAVPATILVLTAASLAIPDAVAASANTPGPHGLTEILYGIASPANNNGSAFTGLSSNTTWYNTVQGVAFVVGRWLLMIPVLALAGSLAIKQRVPTTSGTFPTDGPTFGVLLIAVLAIVTGLTYFPALSLGPVVEFLQ
ncbi:potassium-transporting ATPase subunit KdpA [Euzebya tangerina]|uniref:potassium-transporting ATPase subunit KdpA n=1 Tax=Euzebya tangerina TaxID=591198 RepID=UPI000E321376|nr:potassium-transporting ATPase subunit KdpA [Euzebya tangerina]